MIFKKKISNVLLIILSFVDKNFHEFSWKLLYSAIFTQFRETWLVRTFSCLNSMTGRQSIRRKIVISSNFFS